MKCTECVAVIALMPCIMLYSAQNKLKDKEVEDALFCIPLI